MFHDEANVWAPPKSPQEKRKVGKEARPKT